MPIVSDIIARAQVSYLNDPNKRNYTDALMLPMVQTAADELQAELVAHGVGTVQEISAPINVVALAGTVPSISDLVQPINLWERTPGSAERWQEMDEGDFEPVGPEVRVILGKWKFREEAITVPPCSVARDVIVEYLKKHISATLGTGSNVPVLESLNYLATKASALASATIGRNFDLAKMLADQSDIFKQILLGTLVKNEQDHPVRPQPYKGRR